MLRQVRTAAGGLIPRAGAALAIGILVIALGACSTAKRLKPGSEVGAEVKNPPGASEPYPHLGEVPERPQPAESADSRREIARSLAADREQARYTDQALRGGTEPSATPPPPPVASALPMAGAETGSVRSAEAKPETKKPGFFGRLFGAKEKKAPEAAGPAPLPAQPTAPVDVQEAPPAK